MVFPPFGNSDDVVASVSNDFPSNSKRDSLFHCIAYDYSCADWDDLFIICVAMGIIGTSQQCRRKCCPMGDLHQQKNCCHKVFYVCGLYFLSLHHC